MNPRRLQWIVGLALLVPACAENTGTTATGEATVRGKNGEKLTIAKPRAQDIERGGTETVTVHLKREHFSDPVNISVSDLPAGVEAVDVPRATTGEKVEFVLRANDNADLVDNHRVLVSAEGPEGYRATETFRLSVKNRH
jgi:hypothetical protein